ncbi:MAG: SHOCT domain-containing protein [Candidatus Aminicenantales bacterium]
MGFWGIHMGGWWWFWFVFALLFIAGFVLLIIVLARLIQGPEKKGYPPSREDPLEILKRRYARGEITKEQFEQMKKDLEG